MTISFWMPQAPVERVTPYPDLDPDYREVRCVEPFVEINMTAGNANAILSLIDPASVNFEDDPFGEWDVQKLAEIRAAAIKALNTRKKEAAYVDPFIDQSPGRAKLYMGGRSQEYVEGCLMAFMRLCEVAMEHGFNVVFG